MEVAGLDFGWHERVPLVPCPGLLRMDDFRAMEGSGCSRRFCRSRLFDPWCEVKNSATGEFVLERDTPPGVYQYKFIVDGEWNPWHPPTAWVFSCALVADPPTSQDGECGLADRIGQRTLGWPRRVLRTNRK